MLKDPEVKNVRKHYLWLRICCLGSFQTGSVATVSRRLRVLDLSIRIAEVNSSSGWKMWIREGGRNRRKGVRVEGGTRICTRFLRAAKCSVSSDCLWRKNQTAHYSTEALERK